MPLLNDALADKKYFEGLRIVVYDDANGKNVVPGYTLIGHPTIGYGRALDTDGITLEEAIVLSGNDIERDIFKCQQNLPWFVALDEIRQRVVISMVDNLGFVGFTGFKNFIAQMERGNYDLASSEIRNSRAYRENTGRYECLARMCATGKAVDYA